MLIPDNIRQLIEAASKVAGSQNALARILDMAPPTLIQMKQGKRPANWRVRGKLRAVLGEEPAAAFMQAMAEDLAASENPDEKKAAQQLAAMVKALNSDDGGSGGIRTLDEAQHPILP